LKNTDLCIELLHLDAMLCHQMLALYHTRHIKNLANRLLMNSNHSQLFSAKTLLISRSLFRCGHMVVGLADTYAIRTYYH
jgi:hypothetical protein